MSHFVTPTSEVIFSLAAKQRLFVDKEKKVETKFAKDDVQVKSEE
jgi:hypothetical protein